MTLSQPEPIVDPRLDPICEPWLGRPSEYQFEAKDVVQDRLDRSMPWVYVVPTCGTRMCLADSHLRFYRAHKIAYPANVCTYCGLLAWTRDHLLPVTVTGEAVRKFVAVVPACGECNSAIGDRVGHRISERREEAHKAIEKKHRKLLKAGKRWTPKMLAELGPNLRGHIEASLAKREVVLQRLDWPWEPDYDKRAFEKSGIEDPYGMDLI